VADLIMDPAAWAEMEFGDCDLGDLRRTRRAVRFAAQVARNPGASTPGQAKEWKDLKAAYRLLDMDDVTFEALAKPHWLRTRNPPRGTWLLLCGQTLIERAADTASRKKKTTAGETTGFVLHSSLMVDRTGRNIAGLANQVIRRRDDSAAEFSASRPASPVAAWGQLIDDIGVPSAGRKLVYVFDQDGADFDTLCHLMRNKAGWVVRPPRADRHILTRDGDTMTVRDFAKTLSPAGTCRAAVSGVRAEGVSKIPFEVRFGSAFIPRPKRCAEWIKSSGLPWIPVSLIHAREVKPAKGRKPVEWYLWTSETVATLAASRRVLGWFTQWPWVDEFHRVLKEDCHLAQRRLRSTDRLQAATGVFSVVAVRLLQMNRAATESSVSV